MPKNIIVDNQAMLQALIAFAVTSSIFIIIMIRAWKMRQNESNHMSSLPLDDDSTPSTTSSTNPSHTTKS